MYTLISKEESGWKKSIFRTPREIQNNIFT